MSAESEVTEMYRGRLATYLQKVPACVCKGSWNLSVKFKEWANKSSKAISKTQVKQQELLSLINQYEGFK